MSKSYILIFGLLSGLIASGAWAQNQNQPPVCTDKVLNIDPLPADTVLNEINIDPLKIAGMCTDQDSDTLRVTQVSPPFFLNANREIVFDTDLKAGESAAVTLTVSDGKGGVTTAKLTINRL